MARHRLDQGDLESAMQLYQAVLEHAPDQSDALLMISGDLGNAGHLNEVFDLVLPRYQPDRHALSVGFNLLNACVQAGRRAEGEALLHRIGLLNAPHARDQVAAFGRSLDELKAAEMGPPQAVQPNSPPTIVDVPRPLWHTYLGRPDWLLPIHAPRKARVAVLTLADGAGEHMGGPPRPATTPEGMARSFPLALSEALLMTTDVEPIAVFAVVRGIGPAVPGEPWPGEDVVALGRTEGYELDFIVSGSVSQSETSTAVRLELWDIKKGEAVDAVAKEATSEDAGAVLLDLGQQLLGRLMNEGTIETIIPPSHYSLSPAPLLDGYLTACDMLITLTLAAEGLTDAERLAGERDLLNHFLSLTLAHRQALAPRLALFTGLILNRARGSSLYQEYRAPVLALADGEQDAGTDAFAVTGLAYLLYDRPDALEGRRQQLADQGRGDAAAWLASYINQ